MRGGVDSIRGTKRNRNLVRHTANYGSHVSSKNCGTYTEVVGMHCGVQIVQILQLSRQVCLAKLGEGVAIMRPACDIILYY